MSEFVFRKQDDKWVCEQWEDDARWPYKPTHWGYISWFPGSRQIFVSHGLMGRLEERGRGYSKDYNEGIKNLVRSLGGRAIVAVVASSNEVQHSRLKSLGWERLSNTIWMVRV